LRVGLFLTEMIMDIKESPKTTKESAISTNNVIDDEIVKFLGDQDAQDLQSQHVDDLNDEWVKTVGQYHFKKTGLVLNDNSFSELSSNELLLKISKNNVTSTRINKHPFEWLEKNDCIKLFNILRTFKPDLLQVHEISKDGLRFNILEWLHVFNLLICYENRPELNEKQKLSCTKLLEKFKARFSFLNNLNVSDEMVGQFCDGEARHSSSWKTLQRVKWAFVAITFATLMYELALGSNTFTKVLGLLTMLSAVGVYWYSEKIYPKGFVDDAQIQMACEKLLTHSY